MLIANPRESEQSRNSLSSLDTDLNAFIVEYRKGHADASELMRKHITAETDRNQEAIKLHVTETANNVDESLKVHIGVAIRGATRQREDAQSQAKRDRLVRSLKFDRMNERRNQVAPSHHNTFTWMLRDGSDVEGDQSSSECSEREYDSSESSDSESDSSSETWSDDSEPAHATASWDSFSDWLRSTDLVYWISGKPGSGKTTLMKYLLSQSRTQTYLDEWKPGARIISHFFWRPGTEMQQSIKGLMCSLLHQLLLGEPEIVDHVLRSTAGMAMKETETDWSTEELQETLVFVLGRYSKPVAIFLDGLDEVLPRDGVLRLLDVVDQLRHPCGHTGKTKLCLGSRRETLLYKRLCDYPQLRLEQLNEVDLWNYGKDKIRIPSGYRITAIPSYRMYYPFRKDREETTPSRDEFRDWLVWTIVDKAEGVFLWLYLTVETVTKALNQDESFEDLESRIRSLPSDLADLYTDMWNRMNGDGHDLRIRAATYFQLALAEAGTHFPLSSFAMMVATKPEKAEMLLRRDQSQRISVASVIEACEETRRDTTTRCAGLLVCPGLMELDPDTELVAYPWYGEEYEELLPYVSRVPAYSFLHRTARDFLMDTEAGKGILSFGRVPGHLARLKLLEANLAMRQLFWTPTFYVKDCVESPPDPTASLNSPNLSMVRFVFKTLDPSSEMEEDASVRRELSRLFLLCEQLFINGQLLGEPVFPVHTIQFEQDPRHPECNFYYHTTVKGQHEFLIVAADYETTYTTGGIWRVLLPAIMNRHLDEYTKCRLLVQACTFHPYPDYPFSGLDHRLNAIQSLLGRGALPYHQIASRKPRRLVGSTDKSPIATTETAFRALMTTIWLAATRWVIDNNDRRKLFELIALLITKGADPHEEVFVFIEVKGGKATSMDLMYISRSSQGSLDEFRHIVIVLAYPASALLAHVLQIWKLGDHSRVDWVSEICQVPDSGIGKGRTISIVEMDDESLKLSRDAPIPNIFRSAAVFNLREEDGMEKYFLGLIRFLEESLQSVAVPEQERWIMPHEDCLSDISIPLEIQEEVMSGLQRLRCTDVPVTERRKELRTRLGVTTPIEEPEWQERDRFRRW